MVDASEEFFKEILRRNHVFLTECLNADEVLDHLYEKGVFSEREETSCRCMDTLEEKNRKLLTTLKRKTSSDYSIFCGILQKIQPFIKRILDQTAVDMGADGLVFESRPELEAEFNRRLLEETSFYQRRIQLMLDGIGETVYWLTDPNKEEHLLICTFYLHVRSITGVWSRPGKKIFYKIVMYNLGMVPTYLFKRTTEEYGARVRISRYTNVRVPFNLESSLSPIYLEAHAEVELAPMMIFGPRLLELGLYEDSQGNSKDFPQNKSPKWGICVELCSTHFFEVCTQVWAEERRIMCYRNSMPNMRGMKGVFSFGVVLAAKRGKLGFIDIRNRINLGKFDVDLKDAFYQLFAFEAKPETGAKVAISVTDGANVQMDTDKQALILEILH